MAMVAISYPIEGLALLGWLAQVLEKVLSESLVELPLQLIGILVLGLSPAFLCNSLQNYRFLAPRLLWDVPAPLLVLELLHSGLRLAGNCFKKGCSTHPVFWVCKVCWIELLRCFPLPPSCLGEPRIAPLSIRVGTSSRNGFLWLFRGMSFRWRIIETACASLLKIII